MDCWYGPQGSLACRMLCAYSIGAPILKPEMWADTQGKALSLFAIVINPQLSVYSPKHNVSLLPLILDTEFRRLLVGALPFLSLRYEERDADRLTQDLIASMSQVGQYLLSVCLSLCLSVWFRILMQGSGGGGSSKTPSKNLSWIVIYMKKKKQKKLLW